MDNLLKDIVSEVVGEIRDDICLKNQVNNCVGLFLEQSINPDHRPNKRVREAYFVRIASSSDHFDLNYAFIDMHYAVVLSQFLSKRAKEIGSSTEIFVKPITVKGTIVEASTHGRDSAKTIMLAKNGHYFNIIDWCSSSTMRAYETLTPEQEKELVPMEHRISLRIYKYLTKH